jgi:flagellar M-ring protein FliF
LAVVTLVLGLFVVRPILVSGKAQQALLSAEPRPLALPPSGASAADVAAVGATGLSGALTGEIQETFSPSGVMARTIDAGPDIEPTADHVARLRRLIESRQTESIEILRGWMEKEEEST